MTWKLYEADCFDVFPSIEDHSVDMILCDLPYGMTACRWDTPLPLDELWVEYKRMIKDNGAIVLTASQPFTTTLISSNMDMFRYEIIWIKTKPTGFMNANKMPLKSHENILIFYKQLPQYNPQFREGKPYVKKAVSIEEEGIYGRNDRLGNININDGYRFPNSILKISNPSNYSLHPTQKPVKLFEYLIKTYTNEGDLVLDNCAGSGTTGVACQNLNRNCILIEKEPDYCQIIRERMQTVETLQVEQRKQQTLTDFIPAK